MNNSKGLSPDLSAIKRIHLKCMRFSDLAGEPLVTAMKNENAQAATIEVAEWPSDLDADIAKLPEGYHVQYRFSAPRSDLSAALKRLRGGNLRRSPLDPSPMSSDDLAASLDDTVINARCPGFVPAWMGPLKMLAEKGRCASWKTGDRLLACAVTSFVGDDIVTRTLGINWVWLNSEVTMEARDHIRVSLLDWLLSVDFGICTASIHPKNVRSMKFHQKLGLKKTCLIISAF